MRKIQYPIIKVIITIFAIIVINTSFVSYYNREPDTFPAPSSILFKNTSAFLLFSYYAACTERFEYTF